MRGGGLAVVGTTQSAPGSDDNIARVVRLDAAGTVVWNRTFGANFAAAVTGLPDGGLAVVGFTEPPDVWVLRLDDAGDVVQESTFGGSRDDGAAAVGVLPDGTFVVAGSTESKGAGGSDYWVLRFDRQSLGD